MSMKRLGVALLASLALTAVFASSAFATATTVKSKWKSAGSVLASGETRAVTCSRTGSENLVLRGTVAGLATEITASAVECPSGDVIKQEGENAIATGTLKFSGLTVVKPEGCKTTETITTKALTAKTYMEGTTVYTRFEPTAGPTETFASIPLNGCAAEGSYPVKGTVFGQASNVTGVEAKSQALAFSAAINSTAGGSLLLAGNAASITGKANNVVGGTKFEASETGASVAAPAWNSAVVYPPGVKVSKGGVCYVSTDKEVNQNHEPPNAEWWTVEEC